ncbi:hypothetical protein GH714_018180 [Hevea brasiliensis]|uniref:40S ribosomal protein SA n=1 Tax=Hevea brasiliensis TaxID=3981 RepID=A0A6A6LMS0_HEVBR|nr:hypothetical protein GH714_018180 [Hevea brasiliensis]
MATGTAAAPTRALSQKELDIQMMLAAEVHLGTKNCDFQMERYVFKRRNDGIYIINLGKTWEKLQLAARVIVAIENPQDIIVQSARPYGQRAVLKFAQYTGAHAIAGRHTPGTFTNQLQTSFSEPRLLILTDPRTDHQPIKESSLGSIPPLLFVTRTLLCVMWILAFQLITKGSTVWMWTYSSREPEETKQQEEEEAVPVTDYALPSTHYGLSNTDWDAQIADGQWTAEAAPHLFSAVPASNLYPEQGSGLSNEWDAAAPPAQVAPAPAATGWE